MPTSPLQPETVVHLSAGMSAVAQVVEVRPQGEEWCWLCEDSLKELDCSAPQLREYGKKHGPAREARDHCQAVHEAHRGGPTM